MYPLNTTEGRAILETLSGKVLLQTFNSMAAGRGVTAVKKFENNVVARHRISTLAQLWDLRITDSGEVVEATTIPIEIKEVPEPVKVEPEPVKVEPVAKAPRGKPVLITEEEAGLFGIPATAVEPSWKIQRTGKMPRESSKVYGLVKMMLRPEGMTEEEGGAAAGWDGCSTTASRAAMVAGFRVWYAEVENRGWVYYARPDLRG